MPVKPKAWPYSFPHDAVGIAHNHRHGSANCIQCDGPCRITEPTETAYTGLIRALLESEEYGYGKVPFSAESFLEKHGINLKDWRNAERPKHDRH